MHRKGSTPGREIVMALTFKISNSIREYTCKRQMHCWFLIMPLCSSSSVHSVCYERASDECVIAWVCLCIYMVDARVVAATTGPDKKSTSHKNASRSVHREK